MTPYLTDEDGWQRFIALDTYRDLKLLLTSSSAWVANSVLPDLAKFRHFGKKIKVLGNFLAFIQYRETLKSTLAINLQYWAYYNCSKQPNIEQIR